MQPRQPIDSNSARALAPAPVADEISLVDVAITIWAHRRAAMAAFLAVLAGGLAAAWAAPRNYAYTTTIELGSRAEDGKFVPIESTETTLAKLQGSYIPIAQRRYQQEHPEERHVFAVTARAPNNSQLVVLESRAPEANSAPYRQIQDQAVRDLLADHARVLDIQRLAIKAKKQHTEAVVQALVDTGRTLERQVERLKQTDRLLDQQITDTRALIDQAGKNRARALAEARDEARAMTLLMLDNEVRASRTRLADLQQRLQIGQAEKRDRLQDRLRKNDREQALQRADIQRLDLDLTNLQATRALGIATQSPRPVGKSRSLIVALSVVLGGALAILVSLMLEFLHRVRRALAAMPAGEMNPGSAVALADQPEVE